jgi:hypothetical protein
MLLKLIACNVFMREACHCIARTPHIVDAEFTELGEHVHSETLRGLIQARIDAAEGTGRRYDALLLLYGICGNSLVGVQARTTRLVIPRAHDCCTILLGSRATFKEHFQDNPSMPFSSAGYIERGEYFLRTEDGDHKVLYGDQYAALVEQYGEDNATYIWETMHPPHPELGNSAVFIDIPETAPLGYWEQFKAKAEAEGKVCVRLEGSLHLISKLIFGEWDPQEFLSVPPGGKIAGVYDWEKVIRADPGN